MRRQEDLASSQPHAVHRDVDDGSGFFSVTFTRAKCRSVHSRWGTRKQTVLLANARSSDSTAGYVEHKNKLYVSEFNNTFSKVNCQIWYLEDVGCVV